MAATLADLLDANLVALDLRATDRDGVLKELVSLLHANGNVPDANAFLAKVLARENENTTAVEDSMAFPHARTNLVDNIALAIGRSRAGVKFVAHHQPVQLIFLIAVPQRLVQEYLACVGALARKLKNPEVKGALLSATTPNEFLAPLAAE